MTQPIAANYALAQDLIASGQWRVEPDQGLVYGKKGNPFRRTNSWGYVQIKFRDPADYRTERAVLAHRVVWESVHGHLDSGLTINHLNGIKTDNRMVNLEAVTMQENLDHAKRTGLLRPARGEAAGRARLTNEQVGEIYQRAWSGQERDHLIARDYGVGRSIVNNIKNGWAWTHVTGHEARCRA